MKELLFSKGRVLLDAANALPLAGMVHYEPEGEIFSFREYKVVEILSNEIPEGYRWVGLRDSYNLLSREDFNAATKGAELLHWDRTVRYCPTCGGKLHRASEISKICDDCGREYFPAMAPCVIVLVRKGDEALLVRNASFKGDFYGLIAGFVETGETLEECVAREVMEEVSLKVKNIRYFGSQSWPFPSQLMVAFTAEYESGEVAFADGELCAGGFFTRENHPQIPPPASIGRRLIESWLMECDSIT